MQRSDKSAPADRLQAPGTARLTLISEETRDPHRTPLEQQSLHAVYELLENVARRVREQETGRAA